jgi:hypothetical protein
MGIAKRTAIQASFTKIFAEHNVTEPTLAPKTFLIPITLIRCVTVNVANPKRQRQLFK